MVYKSFINQAAFYSKKGLKKPMETEYETGFGWMRIGDKTYRDDVVLVDLGDGNIRVKERDKSHSEIKYGTSHIVDYNEVSRYLDPWKDIGIEQIIIGTGQYGRLELDPTARDKLVRRGIEVIELETPRAIRFWERSRKKKLGIFHVTC